MRISLASSAVLAWLLLAATMVSGNDYQMVVKVVDCNNKPIVVQQGSTIKVQLSGCVDDLNDNQNAKPVYKPTDANGVAAFTMANQDNDLDTEDVVQFCFTSAGRVCKFDVIGAPTGYIFDQYVLPTSPKERVRDACKCNVCGQFTAMYPGECPAVVNYPSYCDVVANPAPDTIVLKAKTCPPPSQTCTGNKCKNDDKDKKDSRNEKDKKDSRDDKDKNDSRDDKDKKDSRDDKDKKDSRDDKDKKDSRDDKKVLQLQKGLMGSGS